MPKIEQLLYQSEKSSRQRCSIKKVVLKIFAIFTKKHLKTDSNTGDAKFLRVPAYSYFWTDFEMITWTFISGQLLSKSCWLSNIKYQLLSKQSFKHISVHMLSLNINPMLSMFIINSYCTKSKCLKSLDSLLYCFIIVSSQCNFI